MGFTRAEWQAGLGRHFTGWGGGDEDDGDDQEIEQALRHGADESLDDGQEGHNNKIAVRRKRT
ncbi:hypothetical protein, partial [Streptomyces formicae]|uniref:hypothetical protein n=1 Tax=Streptomyces formicae TaxID=1616117 RepID=UPI00360D31FC